MSVWVAVAQSEQVAEGELLAIEVEGRQLVLGRSQGEVFALARKCVHQGGDLAEGVIARGHIICPVHGWRFSCSTGVLTDSGQTCVASYAVREEGGWVEVDPHARYFASPP